jgi:oligoendopeptidase F
MVKTIQQEKLNKLGKTQFKPWDADVDPDGKAPLKPFSTGEELLNGSIAMFDKIDVYFGNCLRTMDEMGHLDLDSKAGKAPGGYNYPLYEIGVPFIFMNSVGAQRDLVTMVHEGGHAVHSFLSRDLELTGFKSLPSEVAELASMSMELLTMNLWNEFYTDATELNRAKKDQLETILKLLPWIAQIDEFQHWVYENPTHSVDERHAKWVAISKEYGTGLTDWTGFEAVQKTAWQRQLHLFEVPFYYIEYGIAQLGALGVWKNSMTNFQQAIDDYKAALRLGYTKSIPEIYETAGIRFDFTENYLKELADFVQTELSNLE